MVVLVTGLRTLYGLWRAAALTSAIRPRSLSAVIVGEDNLSDLVSLLSE